MRDCDDLLERLSLDQLGQDDSNVAKLASNPYLLVQSRSQEDRYDLMTPAQDRYTRFSCPNPPNLCLNRPAEGNLVPRSWTGKPHHIARLRCTACDRAFSAWEGPLLARSKLAEDTVLRLGHCQRWGVCEAGTAAMCGVALQTVPCLQHVAAQRAVPHHRQGGRVVAVPGVQLDVAHATLRPRQVAWLHTALHGFLVGLRRAPWGHVNARQPRACNHRLPVGQGDGVASAMR